MQVSLSFLTRFSERDVSAQFICEKRFSERDVSARAQILVKLF